MLDQAIKNIIKDYLETYEGIKSHSDINDECEMDRMYWQGVLICDILEEANMTKTYEYERITEILDVVMYKK